MSVIAEFRLSGTAIPLVEALQAVPGMVLDVEQTVAEDPDAPLLFVWAQGDDFERFERRLADDGKIAKFGVLESLCDERLYRIRISADSNVGFYRLDAEVGTSRLDVRATHEGVDIRMRFPNQQYLQEYFDGCREQGIEVSLHRLYHDQGGNEVNNQYGLSPKQRETLELAYREGFFGIPRQTTLGEVADALELSEQAVSERLRRATATLIQHALAPEEQEE
jgi:hypothetical protein